MSIKGVTITKRSGGLGRKSPSKDMVSGMVIQGIATADYATLGTVVALKSVEDAEGYGFTAAYDTANTVLVHHHINEFFLMNPDATLYLMVVAQTVTLTDMCDKTKSYVQKLITDEDANGDIRMVAVILNPTGAYTPTLLNGLDEDVLDAVPLAQQLCVQAFEDHIPLDVILIEGRQFNGTATAAKDLRTLEAPNVAVVIGADPAISASNARFNTYACAGTALGALSLRKVDECIGQVDGTNLTDNAEGRFLSAGLSSNLKTSTYSKTDLTTLDTKGYIYVMKYPNYPGVYFNDSHTCTAASDDYAQIENNRTINKATRLIYQSLMPVVKRKILLNADGTIQAQVRKSLESTARRALQPMAEAQEISSRDAYIDPEQNLLSTGKLDVKFSIVPTAIARELEASVGFENPLAG